MKLTVYGAPYFEPLFRSLEADGHLIYRKEFHPDVDYVIAGGFEYMYHIYRNLKLIKKNKIKLIFYALDIPIWRIDRNSSPNLSLGFIKQRLNYLINKNKFLFEIGNKIRPNPENGKINNLFSKMLQIFFGNYVINRSTYVVNYRQLLKESDLILSISNYTKKIVQKVYQIDSEVCYMCVDSDFLLKLPKEKIKYDAINISRIAIRKNQELFVEAANKLGLNILVIGPHIDKHIKLNCPHYSLESWNDVMNVLNESKFFVAPSSFEGFGITPVEAAFLDKIVIASDIPAHREVLGDYPLYFENNNLDDLVDKMKIVINGDFSVNSEALALIKEKYSMQAVKKRFLECIESVK
jgi:glycosyltransferase involved in cell wall biosynthesis